MATTNDAQGQQQLTPPTNTDPGWWAIALITLFAGGILVAIAIDAEALIRLSDPAYARGLITWLIILTTIGIAFILIYQAFNGNSQSDDGFRRGREIFAGLLGMAGTIIGFYFGSAEKGQEILKISVPAQEEKVVRAYITGGTPPYRYIVDSLDKNLIRSSDKPAISEDGWIKYILAKTPTNSTTLTISVIDAKSLKESVKLDIKSISKTEESVDRSKPITPASPSEAAKDEVSGIATSETIGVKSTFENPPK